MWLRALTAAAHSAKQIYSIVFFSMLTWHVVRHEFKKKEPRKWDRQ